MWSNKKADFFPEIKKGFTFPGMGMHNDIEFRNTLYVSGTFVRPWKQTTHFYMLDLGSHTMTSIMCSYFTFLALGGCGEKFPLEFQGSCYYLSKSMKTFQDAENSCVERGGFLTSIQCKAENDWIAGEY